MTRTPVRIFHGFVPTLLLLAAAGSAHGQRITAAGEPAQLDIRAAGGASIRVTLRPVSFTRELPEHPAIAERAYPAPALSVREVTRPVQRNVGSLQVELRPNPLTLVVRNSRGQRIQEIIFESDGTMTFALDDQPVLGMGGGGPRPERGTTFREQPVQFDRRGALDTMEPRWQSDMYGSRNPVAMLLGTRGWGIFVTLPWVHVEMRDAARGRFIPWIPPDTVQGQRVQHEQLGKGTPPRSAIVPGLLDFFVFDAHDPAAALKDFSVITGPAALPPKWALGYMQSHRTLEDDTQLLDIIDTFRAKQIPLDAVIYLGTGFAPRGWNTRQPSFEFNPDVFKRDPRVVLAEMEAKHVKSVVHMVPFDRNRLRTLHGTIPSKQGEVLDESHIHDYWQLHVPLVQAGVDAFWPDEGDWFNLWERLKRHQMYYQGMLLTKPNERPWHLQRNGYPGIAQWGGWVWSGD
ncbi:MAG: TIM-barrel domain-containing protein, partial [Longimicrobiales bacterium]